MIYFVIVFGVLGTVSLVWCVVAGVCLVAQRGGRRGRLRQMRSHTTGAGTSREVDDADAPLTASLAGTTAMKRAGLMAGLWLSLAVGAHWAVSRVDAFVRGIPTVILIWDLRYPAYGEIALGELVRRDHDHGLTSGETSNITDVMLDHPWWLQRGESKEQVSRFDADHPAGAWLSVLVATSRLGAEQYKHWLDLDSPGIFAVAVKEEPGSTGAIEPAGIGGEGGTLVAIATVGRDWRFLRGWPYEITALYIASVQIGDLEYEFAVVETQGSRSDLGRYADLIQFEIRIRDLDIRTGGQRSVRIEYLLDVEPGGFSRIGPNVWRGSIEW